MDRRGVTWVESGLGRDRESYADGWEALSESVSAVKETVEKMTH